LQYINLATIKGMRRVCETELVRILSRQAKSRSTGGRL